MKKTKDIEKTISVSVKVPIGNMEPKVINSAIKDLESHDFKVAKGNGYLEISKNGVKPHPGYHGGLEISGPVNYSFLEGIINLEAISKKLGVPILSNLEELKSYLTISKDETINIIIPDTESNKEIPNEVEEISRQILKNSNKELTLGLEFPSDVEDLINNPKQNLTSPSITPLFSEKTLGEKLKGLVEAFNRLRSEYGNRVSIKPTSTTQEERSKSALEFGIDDMLNMYLMIKGIPPERRPNLDYEYNKKVLRNIINLLKTGGNKVIWVSILNATDLLYTEGDLIKNNTVVFLPPKTLEFVVRKDYIEHIHHIKQLKRYIEQLESLNDIDSNDTNDFKDLLR